MKILICDDSKTMRMLLGRVVKEMGGTDVREASDGSEAIRILQDEQFDLILLDINMPEQDGLTTLQMIKAPDSEHADTLVVMVSSDADHRRVDQATELGAFGYIRKPFKADDLRPAFTQAVRDKRNRFFAAKA